MPSWSEPDGGGTGVVKTLMNKAKKVAGEFGKQKSAPSSSQPSTSQSGGSDVKSRIKRAFKDYSSGKY